MNTKTLPLYISSLKLSDFGLRLSLDGERMVIEHADQSKREVSLDDIDMALIDRLIAHLRQLKRSRLWNDQQHSFVQATIKQFSNHTHWPSAAH